MPRLKPPPNQQPAFSESHETPTEPIEIELAGDEPGETEVELAPAPPPEKVEPEPAPPVEEENPLQKALDAQARAEELQRTLQRERDEALRQSRERDEELTRERGERQDAQYNSVLTAIAAEQSSLDKLEADYAAFASANDWASAAKVQRMMSESAARLNNLEDGKQSLDQQREAAKTAAPEPRRQAAPAPQAPLEFEQRIAQLPDTAKSWLRKHPEFINDSALNKKISAAHIYLVDNKGVQAFSNDYFDALDNEFGFKVAPAAPEPAPQPQRRSMPVSAPVSRDVPTANGQRQPSSKITLTAEERAIAHTSFTAPDMTNAQKELLYAQNKRKLATMRANGQYPQSERN